MKTVFAAEMRELDRRTIEEFGTSGDILMEHAGWAVAERTRRALERNGGSSVLLIAGTGNNGGDIFAAASFLAGTDLNIEVWICGSQSKIKGDAQFHLQKMICNGLKPKEVHETKDLCPTPPPSVMVDGLLGTGARGAPRGFMAHLINWINQNNSNAFILSIDLPSGLHADSGHAEGPSVKADLTVTMGLPKIGLIREEALVYVGSIDVIDIGIPHQYCSEIEGSTEAELIDRSDLQIAPRNRLTHKGNYGHILLLGGSIGYTGAIAMAARAALRSGAGLVSILTPEKVYPIVAQAAGPEVMVHPWSKDTPSSIDFSTTWNKVSAVLAGPGMGRSSHSQALIENLLQTCPVPLVLDADALAVVTPKQIDQAKCPITLTPHPGEFERLFGECVHNRWGQARKAADKTTATLVLKGAGTIVAESGAPLAINLTGNPGMATGGSGDVLAGMISAFIGQGMASRQAAITAVYLHGLAGDFAAEAVTPTALIATDLIEALPHAFLAI